MPHPQTPASRWAPRFHFLSLSGKHTISFQLFQSENPWAFLAQEPVSFSRPAPSSRLCLCQLVPQRDVKHQPSSAGLPRKVAESLHFIGEMGSDGRLSSTLTAPEVGAGSVTGQVQAV